MRCRRKSPPKRHCSIAPSKLQGADRARALLTRASFRPRSHTTRRVRKEWNDDTSGRRFDRVSRAAARRQKVFEEERREIGAAFETRLFVDGQRLLPHPPFGRVSEGRPFLLAQPLPNPH